LSAIDVARLADVAIRRQYADNHGSNDAREAQSNPEHTVQENS
jgi:hypothetical protein